MTLSHHHLPARSGQTQSLVVLLHGFGANGAAMLGLAKALSVALPDTAFLAPNAPDLAISRPDGRMWYTIPELDGSSLDQAEARLQSSAKLLDSFLDAQLAAAGLPASALALVGFSQGAGMCFEVGPRRAEPLAGVVAISGRIKRKHALAAETRSKPPFLILVGAEDRLMTAHDINDAADALAQVGIPVQHITMADTGHGISDQGIQTAKDFLRHVLGGAA